MRACVVVLKYFQHFDWVLFGFSVRAKSYTARDVFWVNMALQSHFLFTQQYILGITNGLRAIPKKTLRVTRPLEARLMGGRLLRVRQKSPRQKIRIPSIKVGMKSKSSFVCSHKKKSLVCFPFVLFLSKLIFVRRIINVINAK